MSIGAASSSAWSCRHQGRSSYNKINFGRTPPAPSPSITCTNTRSTRFNIATSQPCRIMKNLDFDGWNASALWKFQRWEVAAGQGGTFYHCRIVYTHTKLLFSVLFHHPSHLSLSLIFLPSSSNVCNGFQISQPYQIESLQHDVPCRRPSREPPNSLGIAPPPIDQCRS
jgi:hypothetical protein